jgi:hypothetical protein
MKVFVESAQRMRPSDRSHLGERRCGVKKGQYAAGVLACVNARGGGPYALTLRRLGELANRGNVG